MKRSFVHLLLVTVAVVALSCKPPTTNVEEVRKAIDEANARFDVAFKAKDIAGIMSLMTQDPVFLPQNGQAITGRENVEALWKLQLQTLRDLKLRTISIDASGDLAYELAEYTVVAESPGMPAVADTGKYIDVWKRQPDGKWLIAVSISNTSLPAPPPPAVQKKQ